jgi:hypothetical protein
MLVALLGDMIPAWSPPESGEVIAVGIGFVFFGICRGGGGKCACADWPF